MRAVLLIISVLVLSAYSLSLSHQFSRDQTPLFGKARMPYSGIFAATWLGGFCATEGRCTPQFYERWDKESFTIHGLWPNVIREKPYGLYGPSPFAPSFILNNTPLFNNLSNFWPPRTKSGDNKYFLWEQEYNKHGPGFSNILVVYQHQKYKYFGYKLLQQTYFQSGLRFYSLQNLTKLNLQASASPVDVNEGGLSLTKPQLAKIIGLSEEEFLVDCQGQSQTNILEDIQICFRIQPNLKFHHVTCAGIKERDGSSYQMVDDCVDKDGIIRMVGYKKPKGQSQPQVFRPATRKKKDDPVMA